jgi:tape measure domain-containing protein
MPSGADLARLGVVVNAQGVAETAMDLRELSQMAARSEKSAGALSKAWAIANRVFLSVGAAIVTKKLIDLNVAAIQTGMQFEKLGVQMAGVFGGMKEGEQAVAWITKFAQDTPLQLLDTADAMVRMKAMGLDPMNGQLQALVDTNAKLGNSQETLTTMTLALGKAWSRGKMEAEDWNMLLEKGVPIAKMLGDSLGYSEGEIIKFREEGRITRDVIAHLIDEMGRLNEGAAVEFMETTAGKASNLEDAVARAQNQFASMGGVLDEVGNGLAEFTEYIEDLEAKGVFETMGKEVAGMLGTMVDYIPDVLAGMESLVKTFWEWKGFIADIIKNYAVLWAVQKIVGFLVQLNMIWKIFKGVKKTINEIVIAMERFTIATATASGATAKLGHHLATIGAGTGKAAMGMASLTSALWKFELASGAAVLAAQAFSAWLNTLYQDHLKLNGAGSAKWLEDYNERLTELYKLTKDKSLLNLDLEDEEAVAGLKRMEKYYAQIIERLIEKQELDSVQLRSYQANKEAIDAKVDAIIKERKAIEDAKKAEKDRINLEKEREERAKRAREELERKIQTEAEARAAEKAHRAELKKLGQQIDSVNNQWDSHIDLLKELQSEVELTEQEWAAMGVRIKEEIDYVSHLPPVDIPIAPPKVQAFRAWEMEFKEVAGNFQTMIGDALYLGFTGQFDKISDALSAFFNNVASNIADSLSGVFMNMFEGRDANGNDVLGEDGQPSFMAALQGANWKDIGKQAGTAIGMGLVAHAQKSGNVWEGIMGGAISGAMAGIGTGPGAAVFAAIGALAGGVMSLFSGSPDVPRTQAIISPYGTSSQFKDQGMEYEQTKQFNAQIQSLYKKFDKGYRGILQLFEDIDLYDLVGDVVEVATGWMEMSADQFTGWLQDVKLPEIFDSRYFAAISKGLEDLGVARGISETVFREIAKLSGEDRVAALHSFVQAVKILSDIVNEYDWGGILNSIDETPMVQYINFMNETVDKVDLITAAWDNMGLTERAEDVETIGGLFDNALSTTITLLRQIDSISQTIAAQVSTAQENLALRTMAPADQGKYYVDRINDLFADLGEATDPGMIQQISGQILNYINSLSGLFSDEELNALLGDWASMGSFDNPGMEAWIRDLLGDTGDGTVQDWLTRMFEDLDTLAQERLDLARDEAQSVYDELYARIVLAYEALTTMTDELIEFNELLRTTGGLINGGGGGGNTDDTGGVDPKRGTIPNTPPPPAPPAPVVNVTINGVPLSEINAMVQVAVSTATSSNKGSGFKNPPLR